MKTVLFLTLLLINFDSFSQERLSPDQLRTDFEILRGSLEDFHPGLYWYNSKAKTDSLFREINASLDQPMSALEFLQVASTMVSSIGYGHTSIRPPFDENRKMFPLKLKFIEDKAFFIKSWANDSNDLDLGIEIITINNQSIDDIISISLNHLTSDGNRNYLKFFLLNNYFQYVYADCFGSYEKFTFEYKINNDFHSLEVEGLTYQEIVENAQKQKPSQPDPRNLLHENFDSLSTAVLTVKRFADWREGGKKVKYESKLKSIFQSISEAEVENLIVDLRGNGGGKMSWELHSYFTDSIFKFAKNADFILTKNSPYYSHQNLHPWMKFLKRKWLHTWLPGSNKMKRKNDSTWTLVNHEMVKVQHPSSPQFKGNVYMLIDGGTSSAASLFAAKMKSDTEAIFIGEETGGGYYGNTAMEKTYVTLPHSNLILEVPLVRFQLNVNSIYPLGSGVKPDYQIKPAIEDLLNGIDPEMEFTLKLIAQKKLPE